MFIGLPIVLFRHESLGRNYHNWVRPCLRERLVSRHSKLCFICRSFHWNTHHWKRLRCYWATENSFLRSHHCNGPILFASRCNWCYWSCCDSIFPRTTLLASLRVKFHTKTWKKFLSYILKSLIIINSELVLFISLKWWIRVPDQSKLQFTCSWMALDWSSTVLLDILQETGGKYFQPTIIFSMV